MNNILKISQKFVKNFIIVNFKTSKNFTKISLTRLFRINRISFRNTKTSYIVVQKQFNSYSKNYSKIAPR
jgi:hypothetical protein